jgi:hypothetical protein
MKISQSVLLKEIISVYPKIHKKLINTPCEQNAELLNVKLGCHGVLKDETMLYNYKGCWNIISD